MNHIIENFNLSDHLEQLEIITEHLDDVDGSTFTTKHKALKLGEQLTLYLYDSGQATLEYRDREVETFMWDDEAAAMFADIDNVKISELFAMMYSKRWISAV